jgi:hypothetical protein
MYLIEQTCNGGRMNEHLNRGDIIIWKFWSRDLGYLSPKPGVLLEKFSDGRLMVAYCTTDQPGRVSRWSKRLTGHGLKQTSLVRVDRVDVRKPGEHIPVAGHLPRAVLDEIVDMRHQYLKWRKG